MTRVSVPDDYEARDVPLPESMEFDNLRRGNYTGRVAQVREDEDGRYVGVPEDYADGVRDYLGVAPPEATPETVDEETDGDTDADDAPEDGPTCAGSTSGGEECTRPVDEPGGYCFQHGPDEDEETED